MLISRQGSHFYKPLKSFLLSPLPSSRQWSKPGGYYIPPLFWVIFLAPSTFPNLAPILAPSSALLLGFSAISLSVLLAVVLFQNESFTWRQALTTWRNGSCFPGSFSAPWSVFRMSQTVPPSALAYPGRAYRSSLHNSAERNMHAASQQNRLQEREVHHVKAMYDTSPFTEKEVRNEPIVGGSKQLIRIRAGVTSRPHTRSPLNAPARSFSEQNERSSYESLVG
jgi:hypothetical protein